MAKRIYVGSLPCSTSDTQLSDLFSAHGTVTNAHVTVDRFMGQSKGFGFVEMENDEQADAAMDALNGSTQGGRTLVVNQAREREDRASGRGRSGYGGRY